MESAKNVRIIEVRRFDSSPNSPPLKIRSVTGSESRRRPTAAGTVKKRTLSIVVWMFFVKSALSPRFIAAFKAGKTAVAKDIPKRLTAKLWMFRAKLKAANPPTAILIPTIENI